MEKEIQESIDQYFPKGDKRRGEALVVMAISYLEGIKAGNIVDQQARERISRLEMNETKINERTKIHTLDIRSLRKEIQKS